MASGTAVSSLTVGTPIRIIVGSVFGGYKKGHVGRIVSVLENAFTREILYRCEMSNPDKVDTLILLPSEIEALPNDPPSQTWDDFLVLH